MTSPLKPYMFPHNTLVTLMPQQTVIFAPDPVIMAYVVAFQQHEFHSIM